jgi:heterodisulfide reductase subunit A
MRLARLLKYRFPGIEPAMFYMDIQTFDRDFTRRLSEAAREVRFIRSIPAEIRQSSDGRAEIVYHGPEEQRISETFDLVVLSIGISPGPTDLFENLLAADLNADGFLGPDGEGVETTLQGVFVAGTIQGPRSIQDTVSHAINAAHGAFRYVQSIQGGEVS